MHKAEQNEYIIKKNLLCNIVSLETTLKELCTIKHPQKESL